MMTKGHDSHSEMAHARLSDGISVIFDQDALPCSTSPRSCSRSRSRSNSGGSCTSDSNRRSRDIYRGRHKSSSRRAATSSSSSSSSSSRSRSRSHPRCYRPSSRCRCNGHRRYTYGNQRGRSPPRRYRAHSRSYSRSPSSDRYSRHRSYRSRSRSASQRRTYRRFVGRYRGRVSQSPSRTSKTYRSRSRSRSSGRSTVSLSLDDKRELLRTAESNASKILGVEQLDLPESVKPLMEEQTVETSKTSTPEPEARVRPEPVPEKTQESQSSDMDPDEDVPSPKMSPKRRTISFSINNSVAKPAVAAPSCAKVTSRMDNIESRKPYGHWVPVRRTGKSSLPRKHTLTTSR